MSKDEPPIHWHGIVYLLGWLPLHSHMGGIGLGSHGYGLGAYREAYWGYARWVRVMIELGVFKLRVFAKVGEAPYIEVKTTTTARELLPARD